MAEHTVQRPAGATMNDEIDLLQLLAVLLDHKWWIMGITALATTLGIVYALLATPVYQADALLQVESKQGGFPVLDEAVDFLGGGSKAQTEIEIARSRLVLTRAIEQVKANIQVRPEPRSLKERLLPGLLDDTNQMPFAGWVDDEVSLWIEHLDVPTWLQNEPLTLVALGGERYRLENETGQPLLEGKVGETANNDTHQVDMQVRALEAPEGFRFTVTKRSPSSLVGSLRANLGISEKGRDSGILNFTYQGTNRRGIAEMLDAITTNYFLQNIQRRAEEAEKSLEFLQEQLPDVHEKLTQAEQSLSQHRLQTESVDLTMEAKALLDRLVEVEARMNDLSIKESEIAALFTQEHPTYRTLRAQRKSLEKEKERLQEEVKNMPENQQEILRLTRDVELNQQIYLQLQNRDQELRILKAGTVGNVRIIDAAEVQPNRVKPKRSLIVLISTLLGGMLSVGLVLLKAMLNRGVQSADELEQEGVAVYATLPFSEDNERQVRLYERQRRRRGEAGAQPLLALTHPGDQAIEGLRSLRTSLYFAMMDAKNKVIALSGPSPGVGKSFVSSNLAVVLAQAGQKVLLIDADLRKGRLHHFFGKSSQTAGLSGYLAGRFELADVVHETTVEGLCVITRGQIPPNPSELLLQPRLHTLVEQASAEYDIVLVDTPPILAVTDAAIVGQHAGTNLIVTRYGVSTLKEVEQTLDRFAKNKVEVKGTILNAMERTASNAYYYYAYEYGSEER